jgi:tetratricopeptide (TPR) repeat protein
MRLKLVNGVGGMVMLLLFSAASYGQVVNVSGVVKLKQQDGTVTPLAGALVEIYRTDITGKYKVNTDKNGRYTHAGIPAVGTYTIIVSGPGALPTFLKDFRLGSQPENDFELEAGDGRTLTLEQVKGAGGGGTSASREDAKKAKEEYEKQKAKVEEENKKAVELNKALNDTLAAGNKAFEAKNYDQAISLYDQGIQSDPKQEVFFRNKALVLRARGVEKYNNAVKSRDMAVKNAAKDDLKASTEMAEKAVELLRQKKSAQPATGGATPAASNASEEVSTLGIRAENYRLALQTGSTELADMAAKAIQEYTLAETDPAKKAKMQASLGDALFYGGKVDQAVAVYKEALAANPNNLDAKFGLGLALASDPSLQNDKAKAAEAREMLKQFASSAPDTDPRKKDAQDAAAAIEQAMSASPEAAPSKGKPNTRRRG